VIPESGVANLATRCRNSHALIDQSVSAADQPPEEKPVKYLCLVYLDQQSWSAVPDPECAQYGKGLRDSGHWVTGSALQPTSTATTVRVRNGQVSVTDGPFAETKEQLAGFYLIEARDLNEAIALAAKIPPARAGSIEVRPARELDVPAEMRAPEHLRHT
jgi:hypothetical protein